MLVVDSSVALWASGVEGGFDDLGHELVAPPLLWSETRSVLHEMAWRGEVDRDDVEDARKRLERAPIDRRSPSRLGVEAWRIADELGWAKTYDAEYLALGRLLDCRVVTLDARLRRGADRMGLVVAPDEL